MVARGDYSEAAEIIVNGYVELTGSAADDLLMARAVPMCLAIPNCVIIAGGIAILSAGAIYYYGADANQSLLTWMSSMIGHNGGPPLDSDAEDNTGGNNAPPPDPGQTVILGTGLASQSGDWYSDFSPQEIGIIDEAVNLLNATEMNAIS